MWSPDEAGYPTRTSYRLPSLLGGGPTSSTRSTVILETLAKHREEQEALVKHLLEQHRPSKPRVLRRAILR